MTQREHALTAVDLPEAADPVPNGSKASVCLPAEDDDVKEPLPNGSELKNGSLCEQYRQYYSLLHVTLPLL